MSEQHDELNLEALARAVDRGADRMRELMERFEGYEKAEPDENGEPVWVPGIKTLYEEAVALRADEILAEYERREKRPPSEDTRRGRAVRIVKKEQPALYGEYHALAGSIAIGQRWLSNKKASLSALQTLNKTGAQLAGTH